jgi:hypothetical protein
VYGLPWRDNSYTAGHEISCFVEAEDLSLSSKTSLLWAR